ncbi:MAG: hypothetical protein ACSHWW_10855 [Nonlabens sp.]|uniref:hypothetical protein n=1 Tax=Nonlabens sp. TaxID=1888209 RepID=UPI003EF595F4
MKTNKTALVKMMLLLLVAAFTLTSCEKDNNDQDLGQEATISVDSPLVNQVKNLVSTTSVASSAVCVDFVYPFTVSSFDASGQAISTVTVNNDQELDTFFGTVNATDSIAFGYPLSLSTTAGLVTVNSDTELFTELEIAFTACFGMSGGNSGGGSNVPAGGDFTFSVCDTNNDGVEDIDLDDIFAWNLSSTETVAYYDTEADALAQVNPVSSMDSLTLGAQESTYVRFDDSATGNTTLVNALYDLVACP